MEPRLSIVTLGVADLARARAFYTQVLGWKPAPASGGDIVFFQAGGVVLGLYPRALLAREAQLPDPGTTGFRGVTLAQNVRTRDEVDRVLAEIAARGGRILTPAQDMFWGGRSGYFADPDGNPWEVAWNPGFTLDEEGIVRLQGRETDR
jgi:catechol 2,3-dioxygenase-like lactoylglutathione lyase family enzyme